MANITLEEYEKLLQIIHDRMVADFPTLSFELVTPQSLIVSHRAENFSSTGDVSLKSLGLDVFKRQRFKVSSRFASTHCPMRNLSEMRFELKRYNEMLDALTYADASFCGYVVWQEGECPCDDCHGTGQNALGRVCTYCNGKGTR